MCEELWGEAFTYAEAGTKGYVMNFTGPNPNDDLYPEIAQAEPCPDHNFTQAQLQAACPKEVRGPSLTQPCSHGMRRCNAHVEDCTPMHAQCDCARAQSYKQCCASHIGTRSSFRAAALAASVCQRSIAVRLRECRVRHRCAWAATVDCRRMRVCAIEWTLWPCSCACAVLRDACCVLCRSSLRSWR